MSSPLEYLQHIREELLFLLRRSAGLDESEFLRDETLKRAFVRSLEVIGEAAKKLPQAFREQNAQVDWRGMAGMRDHLIHGYFGVDYDLVWDAAVNKAPELLPEIERLIAQAEQPTD